MDFEISLIPQWSSLIMQWVATLVLFLGMRYFLWKPMKEFLAKRSDLSVEKLREAEKFSEEAEAKLNESQITLSDARKKAVDIVTESKVAASTVHDNIIANAQKEAALLKSNNLEKIEQQKEKFEASLKRQVIDISLATAAKVIERELNEEDHHEFIDEFVEKTY